jgi:hypothetical protein
MIIIIIIIIKGILLFHNHGYISWLIEYFNKGKGGGGWTTK